MANKRIKGKQCTIIWHVADLKISHASSQVVTNVIEAINNKYGQVIVNGRRAELVATRGKVHDYLGMTMDYSVRGKVIFSMNSTTISQPYLRNYQHHLKELQQHHPQKNYLKLMRQAQNLMQKQPRYFTT